MHIIMKYEKENSTLILDTERWNEWSCYFDIRRILIRVTIYSDIFESNSLLILKINAQINFVKKSNDMV